MSKPKPNFYKSLFWDVDPAKIDYDKHSKYVIERVLSSGNSKDWNELKRYYGLSKIKEASLNAVYLDNVTLRFMSFYFDIPQKQFKCYERKQLTKELWPS